MRLIDLDKLLKFPIRIDHYDKEHGNEHFVFGIETVLEYAEALPIEVEQIFEDGLCPCDLCKYNPPSSLDGKPCTMCPADRKSS